mgnify:CR=1 FL=1
MTPPESEITTVKSKGRILFPPKPVAKVGSQMTHSVIGEGDIDEATYAKKLMKKLNEQSKVMPMDLSRLRSTFSSSPLRTETLKPQPSEASAPASVAPNFLACAKDRSTSSSKKGRL